MEKTIEILNCEIMALIPTVRDYIEVKDINNRLERLRAEFNDKKQKHIEVLTMNERINSNVCNKMAEAVQNHNIDDFNECYKEISRLSGKYEAQNFRRSAIEKINKVAPAWAHAIQNRDGIHGEKSVPENILDVWKYKQFSATLDDITKESFEKLQLETVKLSKELRKTTEQLVAHKAWYHVLLRIEKNNSMRQSLTGWLQTIKKIGKGTGKKAPMLRRKSRENMLMPKKLFQLGLCQLQK
ncbi:MAG: hypothetical protein LBQ00_05375 [Syntrophobacterales bacterium]|nr:hypothetical protein [Syntrophobacterales bacterium]